MIHIIMDSFTKVVQETMINHNAVDKLPSWLDWFISKVNETKIEHSLKTALFETFHKSETEEQVQDSIIKYNGIAFIFKQNFGRNELKIIHHISQIGGNIYQTEIHFGAIQWLEEDLTYIVTIDIPQLLGSSAKTSVQLV